MTTTTRLDKETLETGAGCLMYSMELMQNTENLDNLGKDTGGLWTLSLHISNSSKMECKHENGKYFTTFLFLTLHAVISTN